MNEQRLSLDLSKRPATAQVVRIRQGDRSGTVLSVAITDNGQPLDLAGLDAELVAKLPDGALYLAEGEVSGSTAVFEIDEELAAASTGITELAYVEIEGTDTICSTQAFTLEILPAGRSME